MNQVYLVGNLGGKPELKYTQAGLAILNLSIATAKKVKEEWKTTWHRVVAFGAVAELGKDMEKGMRVFVSGELEIREWVDQQGAKKTMFQVNARELVFAHRDGMKRETQEEPKDNGDIPF